MPSTFSNQVHNHGPDEGPGLACRELTRQDGSIVGMCVAFERMRDNVGIDAAGRALWQSRYGNATIDTWESLTEELREYWRASARTVVTAYLETLKT